MRLRQYELALVATLGLLPLPALAHLVSTGFGPVYDGIGHFFLSIEDLLPLLALMALGGLHDASGGRRVMLVLPGVWLLCGLLGTLALTGAAPAPYVTSVLAILLGVLVAADVKLSLTWLSRLIVLVAATAGLITGNALATTADSVKMLAGSTAALSVIATIVPAIVVKFEAAANWTRIAVRVGGSWIAGAGLLILGWQIRGA